MEQFFFSVLFEGCGFSIFFLAWLSLFVLFYFILFFKNFLK